MKIKKRARGLGLEVDPGMNHEQKVARRAALNGIRKEYSEKEWRLRDTCGPHSIAEQHYPKVIFAKPNNEEE